jgi:hypothetical protein
MPAPANDLITNAELLTGTAGSVSGTNVDATTDAGEEAIYGGYGSIKTVWYLYHNSNLYDEEFTISNVADDYVSNHVLIDILITNDTWTSFADLWVNLTGPNAITYTGDTNEVFIVPATDRVYFMVFDIYWNGGSGNFSFDWMSTEYVAPPVSGTTVSMNRMI